MDHVLLVGAEDVSRAAQTISSAAQDMQRAANNIEDVFRRNQQFLDEWLGRLESVISEIKTKS